MLPPSRPLVHWLRSDWPRCPSPRQPWQHWQLVSWAPGAPQQLEEAPYPFMTVKVGDDTSAERAAESRSTAHPFTRAEEASCVAEH